MRTLRFALPVILLLAVLAACVESESADDSADDNGAVAEEPTSTPEPEEPDPTATPEPEPEPTETPEEAETPTPEATDDDDAFTDDDAATDDDATDDGENGEAVEHIVEIEDPHDFVPDELVIAAGDTVTFVNMGRIAHTSTLDPEIARDPDNAILPEGAETWDSGTLEPGDEFSITLDVPGEYVYFCRPHEVLGQVATISVNGDDVENGEDDDTADVDDGSDEDDDDEGDEADDYL